MLLNPRRTRTNMKLLQLVWIFLLTLCGQSAVINIHVKEDDEAILDCSFGTTNIENKKFDWKKDEDSKTTYVFFYSERKPQPDPKFGNRVSHFPDELQFGNASIKITKAETSDSGTYKCYYIPDVRIPQPELLSTISLTVGAAPRPIVTSYKSNDGVVLQCEVLGAFPKPEVAWWDSAGNVLALGDPRIRDGQRNKYDTVLNITVNEAGFYRCVATQKDIYHQVYTEAYVPHPGGASKPDAKEINETKDGVLIQCIVQDPSPQTKVSWKNKAGQEVPSKEQKTENSIILLTTVTKTDYYRCVTTEGKKDDEVYSEIRVKISKEKPSIVVPVVVAVLVTAVVSVVLTAVIVCRFRSNTGGSTTDVL